MLLLAIDPGARGSLAIRWPNNTITTHPLTSESDLLETLQDIRTTATTESLPITAYIEQVGGYIGSPQPGSSMFNFGRNFGFILGACQALRFTIHLIPPAKWQKAFPTKTKKSQNSAQHKRELKDHAARLFPNHRVTLTTADSLLILHYASQQQH